MTIHDLRKIITIVSFYNDVDKAEFQYLLNGKSKTLIAYGDSFIDELLIISSIDERQDIIDGYKISQWDALNLVIRHEYANYMDLDINDLDIGKSIDNLTK